MQQERRNEIRINRRIRVTEVRLIDAEGEQLGIVPTFDALKKAEDAGLDLVEVSPSARPPVCRIMDYGKYLYLQKKKASEHKHTETQLKELKLGFKTGEHDVQRMVRRAVEFLQDGHKVKVTLRMVGRENAHAKLAKETIDGFVQSVGVAGKLESPIRFEGKSITMILVRA